MPLHRLRGVDRGTAAGRGQQSTASLASRTAAPMSARAVTRSASDPLSSPAAVLASTSVGQPVRVEHRLVDLHARLGHLWWVSGASAWLAYSV